MKKELSWIPLVNGSEANRTPNGTRYASDQIDPNLRHNVDRKQGPGNCASFISEICRLRSKHKHAQIVKSTGLQIAKSAIEVAAAMQYFDGRCRSRFTSLNLSSLTPGGRERSSRRIPGCAS